MIRTSLKIASSFTFALCEQRNKSDEYLFAQVDVVQGAGHERLAESRRRKNVGISSPLELNDVPTLDRQFDLLGDRALGPAILQRGESVAVHGGIGVRRICIEDGPRNPTQLAVGIDALPTNSTRARTMKSPFILFHAN